MKCSSCPWVGQLGQIQYELNGWTFTEPPECLMCRVKRRQELRDKGVRRTKVVRCPS